jgi:hypothetical protein
VGRTGSLVARLRAPQPIYADGLLRFGPMLTGAIIGCVVALAMIVINRGKAKKGTGLPGQLEQVLRGKEPMAIKEIAKLVGKDTLLGRGDVAQALDALRSVGKVRVTPAPAGTPQLKKVDFITYQVIANDSAEART